MTEEGVERLQGADEQEIYWEIVFTCNVRKNTLLKSHQHYCLKYVQNKGDNNGGHQWIVGPLTRL